MFDVGMAEGIHDLASRGSAFHQHLPEGLTQSMQSVPGWILSGTVVSTCSKNSQTVFLSAVSTRCVTANYLIRSIATNR